MSMRCPERPPWVWRRRGQANKKETLPRMGTQNTTEALSQPAHRLHALLNAAALALAVCWLVLLGLTLQPDDDFAQFRRGAVDLREHNNPYYTRGNAETESQRLPGTVD